MRSADARSRFGQLKSKRTARRCLAALTRVVRRALEREELVEELLHAGLVVVVVDLGLVVSSDQARNADSKGDEGARGRC